MPTTVRSLSDSEGFKPQVAVASHVSQYFTGSMLSGRGEIVAVKIAGRMSQGFQVQHLQNQNLEKMEASDVFMEAGHIQSRVTSGI